VPQLRVQLDAAGGPLDLANTVAAGAATAGAAGAAGRTAVPELVMQPVLQLLGQLVLPEARLVRVQQLLVRLALQAPHLWEKLVLQPVVRPVLVQLVC
jgi:hypothetical protein